MKNVLMSVTLASAVALLSQCAAAGNVTYHLDDLDLSTMTKGSNAVNTNKSTDGNPLTINKTTYEKGVGTHAESHYVIRLNGKGVSFKAKGGLDDEQLENGTPRSNGVIFKVVNLDSNTEIASTGVVYGGTDAVSLTQTSDSSETINLAGIQKIDLVVDPNGDNGWDHADWVETELVCSEAIFVDETKRLWNATESGKSITDGAAWNPTFTGGYPTHCDFFAINSETAASLGEGESFSTKKLFVGYGVTLDQSGNFHQDAASDHGAVLNMSGGTMEVLDELFVGAGYADYRDCIMNVTGGTVSAGKLSMGGCASNNSKCNVLVLDSAQMFLTAGDSHISTYEHGTSEIELKNGARLSSQYSFYLGSSGKASMTVGQGSTADISGSLTVGNNGYGKLVLDGGTVSERQSENLYIARENSGSGFVHVKSGTLAAGNDIYLGARNRGVMTIDGGVVSCSWWLDFNREGNGGSDRYAELNLNGGVLKASKINRANGTAVLNWNGGVFRPNGNNSVCIESPNAPEVNVLSGGAIVDTTDSVREANLEIRTSLIGEGGFRKLGEGNLKLTGAVDLKRGFRVEGGSLSVEGAIAETTATTPLKEIVVADGASLNLNGKTVHVLSYNAGGTEKPAGTYQEQGGTIVVADTLSTPVSAIWTNACGDGDVSNSDNWICRNSDGVRIWDVVPTAESVVTVSCDGIEAVNGISAKETVLSVSGSAALSSAPSLASAAVGWYDASDVDALAVDADGTVTGISNKGAAASSLDLSLANPGNARKPTVDAAVWSLNGHPVIAFTNAFGFASANKVPDMTSASDKTTLVLYRHACNTYRQYNDEGSAREDWMNEMFPLGVESESKNEDGLRVEDGTWGGLRLAYGCDDKGNPLALGGGTISSFESSNNSRWQILDMNIAQGAAVAHCWDSDTDHFGTSDSGSVSSAIHRDFKIYLGYRKWYGSSSAGLVAEAFVFDRALGETELAKMRAYLKLKWFGDASETVLPGSLSLADAASLDLSGADVTFANVYGSGLISNGSLTIADTLVVTVRDDGTIDPITVDGTLTIGANARLVVKNANRLAAGAAQTVVAATKGVSGTFSTVVCEPSRYYAGAKVSLDGKSIVVSRRGGLLIIVQ